MTSTLDTQTPFDVPEVHRRSIRDSEAVAAHFAIDTAAMLDSLGTRAICQRFGGASKNRTCDLILIRDAL